MRNFNRFIHKNKQKNKYYTYFAFNFARCIYCKSRIASVYSFADIAENKLLFKKEIPMATDSTSFFIISILYSSHIFSVSMSFLL